MLHATAHYACTKLATCKKSYTQTQKLATISLYNQNMATYMSQTVKPAMCQWQLALRYLPKKPGQEAELLMFCHNKGKVVPIVASCHIVLYTGVLVVNGPYMHEVSLAD